MSRRHCFITHHLTDTERSLDVLSAAVDSALTFCGVYRVVAVVSLGPGVSRGAVSGRIMSRRAELVYVRHSASQCAYLRAAVAATMIYSPDDVIVCLQGSDLLLQMPLVENTRGFAVGRAYGVVEDDESDVSELLNCREVVIHPALARARLLSPVFSGTCCPLSFLRGFLARNPDTRDSSMLDALFMRAVAVSAPAPRGWSPSVFRRPRADSPTPTPTPTPDGATTPDVSLMPPAQATHAAAQGVSKELHTPFTELKLMAAPVSRYGCVVM